MPSLAGAGAASAAATLAKAGITTTQIPQISATVPARRLIGTSPASGAELKPGSQVTLVVSAGYPEIAVDNGREVLALNGATGKVVARIAAGPIPATQPSWSPQGTDIAYISVGRIWLTAASGPGGPRRLVESTVGKLVVCSAQREPARLPAQHTRQPLPLRAVGHRVEQLTVAGADWQIAASHDDGRRSVSNSALA